MRVEGRVAINLGVINFSFPSLYEANFSLRAWMWKVKVDTKRKKRGKKVNRERGGHTSLTIFLQLKNERQFFPSCVYIVLKKTLEGKRRIRREMKGKKDTAEQKTERTEIKKKAKKRVEKKNASNF